MMAADWRVRRASQTDAEAILAIERACVEAPHWSEVEWQQGFAEEEGAEPACAIFVAEDGSGIVGFAVVSCAVGVAELESIAVREAARCRGMGRALCGGAMEWSRSRGAGVIELEVRASSEGARALYRSLGFAEQGGRRGYYRDPREDAVLMSAAL